MHTGRPVLATTLAGMIAVVASPALSGEDQYFEMRPMMAKSVTAGGKHVLSYFRNGNGACRLTLMIADEAADPAVSPSRVDVAVQAGLSAGFAAGDGKALHFGCTRTGDAMTAWRSSE